MFSLSDAINEVDTKEKNNPIENNMTKGLEKFDIDKSKEN